MADTLRAKQNMEILDVFKNLNSQIVGLQNKQIAAFPETRKPKVERDVGVEVNVDKSIENINRVIETKLGALEYLVQNISTRAKGLATAELAQPFVNAQHNVTNTGDIVPLWNAIVRFYKTPLLSRDSQEAVKVKVQELEPNLEAMIYGLNSAIDYIFAERTFTEKIGLALLDLLRTLAVYKGIKSQVDTAEFKLITNEILLSDFKNVFQDLSAERLTLLKKVAPRGLITSSAIRNIPDFNTANYEERISAIEDDLGIILPREDKDALKKLSESQFTRAIQKYQEAQRGRESLISQEEWQVLQQAEKREIEFMESSARVKDINVAMETLALEIENLESGLVVSRGELENSLMVEPELPVEPVRPVLNAQNARKLRDGTISLRVLELYREAFSEYIDEMEAWYRLRQQIMGIRAHNRFVSEMVNLDEADRQEEINARKRDLEELLQEGQTAFNKAQAAVDEINRMREQEGLTKVRGENIIDPFVMREKRSLIFEPLLRQFLMEEKSQKITKKSAKLVREAEAEEKGLEGDGMSHRGISSMNEHYGICEEDSDSDTEDPVERVMKFQKEPVMFDDRRNEHFYTRPKK